MPYASKNSEWVGYDDRRSYEVKVSHLIVRRSACSWNELIRIMPQFQVQYMKDMKFGGGFVWALDLDDFKGEFCNEGAHPLLSHLRKLIDSGRSSKLH